MISAVWFRSDLRVHDNPALHHAIDTGTPVVAFYFFTPEQHKQHGHGATKLRFMLESVVELSNLLDKLKIPLIIELCTDYRSSVNRLVDLCIQHHVDRIYINIEEELNEQRRDQDADIALTALDKKLIRHRSQTLICPTHLTTQQGLPYRVFTPYKRAWIKQAMSMDLRPLPKVKAVTNPCTISATDPTNVLDWQTSQPANLHWPAGEQQALRNLKRFLNESIELYHDCRDYPADPATSKLSPYLAVGSLSPRTCFYQAMQSNQFQLDAGHPGKLCWINELIWREFYKYLSSHFPNLCRGHAFQGYTSQIPWSNSNSLFEAWTRGETGYPLVDAGMRQLNNLGWMHNRLRMVTAMFLTKHLFIHWKMGEKYFMQQLIDGDFSANNGGWQWSASTGADAAPYFRVFNPTRQSERFDPKGDYIKSWVPELSTLDQKSIHAPSDTQRRDHNYPPPIVDHRSAVAHAKRMFQAAKDYA